MSQSKKRKQQQKDCPLKVNIVYAPPSPEGDDCWLRALKILMETEPKEEDTDDF